MRISFITTVLNEQSSIEQFLSSLLLQMRLPDETIIVDGGSSDATIKIIESQVTNFKKKGVDIHLYVKKGNRSVGRNHAIKKSRYSIIAVSDAGCILDKLWLKNLEKSFLKSQAQVVSGFYHAKFNSIFEKALSTYTCVMPDSLNPADYLPASRSIAFKKAVWAQVGGYPEYLNTCEDLIFAKTMKEKGIKFAMAENALVYWPQRSTLFAAFWQLFSYAQGDGEGLFIRPTVLLLYARYLLYAIFLFLFWQSKSTTLLIALIIVFFLYVVASIHKNYRYVGKLQALYLLPILQVTSDFAVLLGTSIGILKRFLSHKYEK